jgi:hypothetical protein
MKNTFRFLGLPVVLAFVASACGGGSSAALPNIELTPSVTDAEIESTYSITITNTGDKPLTLGAAATMTVTGCPGDADGTNPFTLVLPADVAYPLAIAPQSTLSDYPGMAAEILLTVNYDAIPSTCDRVATVTITSDDPDRPTVQVRLKVVLGEPNIAVPEVVDLGFVPENTLMDGTFTISNTGSGDLHVKSITFLGAAGFFIKWPCVHTATSTLVTDEWLSITSQAQTIGPDDCQEIVIQKNESFGPVPVKYQSSSSDKAVATIVIVSDDPDYDAASGVGAQVELRANYGGPCVRVIPAPIEFGSVILNDIKAISVVLESCGDEDVEIQDIVKQDDSSSVFQVDTVPLGAFNAANPLVLTPGAKSQPFYVKCMPEKINTDATGSLVADTGTLLVKNSSAAQVKKVPLKCLATKAECAVCEFTIRAGKNGKEVKDGDSINPMYKTDVLYFTDESYDLMVSPNGIKRRLWSIDPLTKPQGSPDTFNPTNTFSPVTYQPNIVGTYTFALEVENEIGCIATCQKTVKVAPPPGCHIELTWNTPSDPDQTDTCCTGASCQNKDCGSDMDLHVVHPKATGLERDMNGEVYGYFDTNFDNYWMNSNPMEANPYSWDAANPKDPLHLPHLDRDDTDGAGPENWTYAIPVDGLCYRVGVNYFDDHGWGRSYPTIRVYTNGSATAVYDKTLSKAMNIDDMWDVGRVCCTDVVTPFIEFTKPSSGEPVIVANYPTPFQ